jgi:REP element-mobilizing transposase RayT
MSRLPRVVVVDVPHHVTQRGNARQVILASDSERSTYLALLRQYSDLHGLALLGYCLMSNHVHLIVIPHSHEALAQTLKHARAVRRLLECVPVFDGPCVAGAILFLCPGRGSPLGGAALRRVEPERCCRRYLVSPKPVLKFRSQDIAEGFGPHSTGAEFIQPLLPFALP